VGKEAKRFSGLGGGRGGQAKVGPGRHGWSSELGVAGEHGHGGASANPSARGRTVASGRGERSRNGGKDGVEDEGHGGGGGEGTRREVEDGPCTPIARQLPPINNTVIKS
jgi:hypothetical protein